MTDYKKIINNLGEGFEIEHTQYWGDLVKCKHCGFVGSIAQYINEMYIECPYCGNSDGYVEEDFI